MTRPQFITKWALVAYLKRHREAVFVRRSSGECPLAKASGCHVGLTLWGPPRKSFAYVLPLWATLFIRQVDDSNETTVTGARALKLLGVSA